MAFLLNVTLVYMLGNMYVNVIYYLFLYRSLYHILRYCILQMSHANGGYMMQEPDARIDTEITGE